MGGVGFAVFARFGGLNKHVLHKYRTKTCSQVQKQKYIKILLATFRSGFIMSQWVTRKIGGS
jgi:hypothetical protein